MPRQEWIPVPHAIAEDLTVVRIAGRLKLDRDMVVGKLIRFWSWVCRETSDGILRGVDPSAIDGVVGLAGFASALVEAGELRQTPSGLQIARYENQFAPHAKSKLCDAYRKSVERQRARPDRGPDDRPDKSRTGVPAAKSKERREEKSESSKHGSLRLAARSEPAVPPQAGRITREQLGVAHMLRQVTFQGKLLYTPDVASVIARHPKASSSKVQWATGRFLEEAEDGHVENPGAYLRALITREDPPPTWFETEQCRRVAEAVRQLGRAVPPTNTIPEPRCQSG